MGDKSAKSKQRTMQQKGRAKAEDEAKAQSKQNSYSQTKILGVKTKG
jgi:hypothetical protein